MQHMMPIATPMPESIDVETPWAKAFIGPSTGGKNKLEVVTSKVMQKVTTQSVRLSMGTWQEHVTCESHRSFQGQESISITSLAHLPHEFAVEEQGRKPLRQ